MKIETLVRVITNDIITSTCKFGNFKFTPEEIAQIEERKAFANHRASVPPAADSNIAFPEPAVDLLKLSGPQRELPWIYSLNQTELWSPQLRIFGVYALRKIVRGYVIGAYYFEAGEVLRRQKRFYAPLVLLYYTAAFHLLTCTLALWGCVVLEQSDYRIRSDKLAPSFDDLPEPDRKQLSKKPELIVRYYPGKGWTITNFGNHSHKRLWSLLNEFWEAPDFPLHINDLIAYEDWQGGSSNDDLITAESAERALKLIPKFRHEAHYRGLGFDPFSLMLLENRESGPLRLELVVEEIRKFSLESLNYIGTHLSSILHEVCAKGFDMLLLWSSWDTPPIEWPDWEESHLRSVNKEAYDTLQLIYKVR